MRRSAIGGAAVILLAACGGSAPPPRATHDDFREIQRLETAIARQRPVAMDPTAPCPQAGRARDRLCEAAETLCRIANDTSDLDARQRCRQAELTCREARGTACRDAEEGTR